MITRNHDFVGATLAVARSNVKGRGKPCPYNIKWSLCAEVFVEGKTIIYIKPELLIENKLNTD